MEVIRRRLPRHGQHGQSLVEFALVMPIIFLLIVAVFDMGRAVFAYTTLANAARQGARVAAVNQLYPAESITLCNESMPVEDPFPDGIPTWSARACTASAATSLGIHPGGVTVRYSTPSGSSLACPVGPSPSTTTPFHVGCIASITVTYHWTAITPVIGNLMGDIAMSATSQMPVERVFP